MIVASFHPHNQSITIGGQQVKPGSNQKYRVTPQQLKGMNLRTLLDGTTLTIQAGKQQPASVDGCMIREIDVQAPGILAVNFLYRYDPGDWDHALSLGRYEAIICKQFALRLSTDDDFLGIRDYVKGRKMYSECLYWPDSFTFDDIEAEVSMLMDQILQPARKFSDDMDQLVAKQFQDDMSHKGKFAAAIDKKLWKELSEP
jgi:hypothetical protein